MTICKCCGASYEGEFWAELPKSPELGDGLCCFCDPHDKKWFIKDKDCHKLYEKD